MKKFLLILVLSFSVYTIHSASAQIICIFCYDQNDSISTGVNNLLSNGGFENSNCVPWGGGGFDSYCPSSMYYGCDIVDWTCTGGGQYSYPVLFDGINGSNVAEGIRGAYFGNGFAGFCSSFPSDTTCISDSGCTVIGIPAGYPTNDPMLGGALGINLSQTVNGLTPGNVYILEFWAGGEGSIYFDEGIFAVDIGFGYIFLRCPSTNPGVGIGRRYVIEFYATASSHSIKFTSWGHKHPNGTELVLDDVRLYTLAELSPSVPSCLAFPVASFSAPNMICPGTCTDFTNLSVNGTSYIWIFPGANTATSTDFNPVNICYNTPGVYDVTLIASSSFGSDTLLLADYITVYPTPLPQGIFQSGDTLFANPGAVSYQWYYNGNAIPGATSYFYVAFTSGDYNVVATDNNGCEVEAVINNVIAGLTSARFNGEGVMVFPNPVLEKLSISGLHSKYLTSISVSNLLGEKSNLNIDYENLSIDCRELPSGIYYLEINLADKILRTKFVKSD